MMTALRVTRPLASGAGSVVTCNNFSGAGCDPAYSGCEAFQVQPTVAAPMRASAAARILRLGVRADLLAQRLVVDAGLEIVLQTIGERDHHVRHAAILH